MKKELEKLIEQNIEIVRESRAAIAKGTEVEYCKGRAAIAMRNLYDLGKITRKPERWYQNICVLLDYPKS